MKSRRLRPHPAARLILASGLWFFASTPAVRSAGGPTEWQPAEGGRGRALVVPTEGRTGFTRLSPDRTGLRFTNRLTEATAVRNRLLYNGSGVALGDVNGDGWCDLYGCQLEGPNTLYLNRGGWRFEDDTARAGVACPDQLSTGAAFADLDGDGDLDLLVNALGGGTREFLNDGTGRFTELTGTPLLRQYGSMSLALGDVDGDGDLDLYVANYRTDTYQDRPPGLKVEARVIGGQLRITPPGRFVPYAAGSAGVQIVELGEPDVLYLNDGQGRFTPVSFTDGRFLDAAGRPLPQPPKGWGMSVILRDLNGDRQPDIYVCNDFLRSRDEIWLSQPDGRYRAPGPHVFRNMSLSAMGLDVGDLNRDGFDDLLVTEMVSARHVNRQRQRPGLMPGIWTPPLENADYPLELARNTLQLNRGDNTYAEIAQLAGLDFSEWSWDALFLDVDLDGWEDVLIPSGSRHDVQDGDVARAQDRFRRQPDTLQNRLASWALWPRFPTPVGAFRNQRNLTFTAVGPDWGFRRPGIMQGAALADLDNDGDLDLVANQLNGPLGVWRNDSPAPRLAIRLHGPPGNRFGIGAKLRVLGGPVPQTQEMMAGGRYLSGDDSLRVFAAGRPDAKLTVEVTWRDGKHTVHHGLRANRLYELDHDAPASQPAPPPPAPTPWFEDASPALAWRHADGPFNDYERQPLLARKLSRAAPGVAWFDLDQDGREDLLLGGGRGGAPVRFRNLGGGRFATAERLPGAVDSPNPDGALLGWIGPDGRPAILRARDGYAGSPEAPGEILVTGEAGDPVRLPAPPRSCPGALALGDMDGDGQLDLFVGGRVTPGRYPEPASSRVFRRTNAGWEPDPSADKALARVGLVRAALWSDLLDDARPELVLACEWGPIRVFSPDPKGWRERTRELGLHRYTGWWNGLTAGDFDEDGRLDIVAGNWGRNTRFQRHLHHPVRLWYGDFTETGRIDLLDAIYPADVGRWVAWRNYEAVQQALPFIAAVAPTYRAFGETDIAKLLGPAYRRTRFVEANTLDTTLFLNRGQEGFVAKPLPIEAQFAPAFGVTLADFDGDGHEDVALSQNFFAVERETSRYDAGAGLILRGDGKGGFTALSPAVSGVAVWGQQRGCATADYDADGRPDLVVAQNNRPLRLFHNTAGAPGLRVKLAGPPGNPTAVGAQMQLEFAEGARGPLREVRAGDGWWSQNGAVQVLATPKPPVRLHVRWPDGRRTTHPVPAGSAEITASQG